LLTVNDSHDVFIANEVVEEAEIELEVEVKKVNGVDIERY